MIHPNLATMLAVVTTDYPLEPGEAIELPPAGGRRELQLDLGRRRVLDERHVVLLANGASGVARTPATTRVRARRCSEVCADLAAPDRRRRRGRHGRRRDRGQRRRERREAKAIARRIATSPLVKTALFGHDANWGRVLVAAGLGAVQRRLRRARARPRHAALQRHRRHRGGAPQGVEPDVAGAELHDRARPRARRRRAPAT